jgi:hypothetical protein
MGEEAKALSLSPHNLGHAAVLHAAAVGFGDDMREGCGAPPIAVLACSSAALRAKVQGRNRGFSFSRSLRASLS